MSQVIIFFHCWSMGKQCTVQCFTNIFNWHWLWDDLYVKSSMGRRTCEYIHMYMHIKCCWDDLYARHRMVRRTCECCYSEVGPWTMAVPQHHRLSVLIQQCFLNMCCFILCFRNFSWVGVVFRGHTLPCAFRKTINSLLFPCCPIDVHILYHTLGVS